MRDSSTAAELESAGTPFDKPYHHRTLKTVSVKDAENAGIVSPRRTLRVTDYLQSSLLRCTAHRSRWQKLLKYPAQSGVVVRFKLPFDFRTHLEDLTIKRPDPVDVAESFYGNAACNPTKIVADQVNNSVMLGRLFGITQYFFPGVRFRCIDCALHRKGADHAITDRDKRFRGEHNKLILNE